LEGAGGCTTGRLRVRLARLVIAADPDGARRRYKNAVVGRWVGHGPDVDGTWLLEGRSLRRAELARARLVALVRRGPAVDPGCGAGWS
jgi:hypothetical protein